MKPVVTRRLMQKPGTANVGVAKQETENVEGVGLKGKNVGCNLSGGRWEGIR